MGKKSRISIFLLICILCSGIGFEFFKTEASFLRTDLESSDGSFLTAEKVVTVEPVSTGRLFHSAIEDEKNGEKTEHVVRTLLSPLSDVLIGKSIFTSETAYAELCGESGLCGIAIVDYIQKKDGKKS